MIFIGFILGLLKLIGCLIVVMLIFNLLILFFGWVWVSVMCLLIMIYGLYLFIVWIIVLI